MVWVKIGEASKQLGVCTKTLRQWADAGRIKSTRTPGGTRLYDTSEFGRAVDGKATGDAFPRVAPPCAEAAPDVALAHPAPTAVEQRGGRDLIDVAYCRVSSAGQKADLERQVAYLRERCPRAEVVRDVGSGLNFKRKGLRSILERALKGHLRSVTVAHRDRLCRFGFELVQWLLERQQVRLVVLDDQQQSPESEFTEDLLAIVHVFSCRFNGLRRYRKAAQEEVEGRGGAKRKRGGGGGGAAAKRRAVQDAEGPAPADA